MKRSRVVKGRATLVLSGLRATVGLVLVVHGVARISLSIVDEFGGVRASQGLPLGTVLAWSITLFELAGGTLLALGYWARPLALLFMVQLAAGVALVHGPEGWFVVGAGRNGMEYSVLLIAILAGVAYSADK